MIAEDVVDAVIGLGKNLFYNSSMESCLLICRKKKSKERKGKIVFIDAKDEIRLERSTAYLKEEHIQKIANTYHNFQDIEGFAKVVSKDKVLQENNGNLSIQLYVESAKNDEEHQLEDLLSKVREGQEFINNSMIDLFSKLEEIGIQAQ